MPATRPTAGAPVPIRLIVALGALSAVAPIGTDMYLPGFPAMAAHFGTSASAVQISLTAFLFGLAGGQLLIGPISDRLGRRPPLLVTTVLCALASVVVAAAPTLHILTGARLVQGLAGAGGMVIARAVLADVATGRAAARGFTLMFTVTGIAPIVAPIVGGLLLGPIGWRGILWVVAGLSALAPLVAIFAIPETHRASDRDSRRPLLADLRIAAATRGLYGPMLVAALSFAMLMSYVSSSPFVYQDVIGLTPQQYAVAFGLNAASMIASSWIAGRSLDRFSPRSMIRVAIVVQVIALAVFAAAAEAGAPTWFLPVPILIAVSAFGWVMGNSAALAMSQVRPVAGSGSALLGFSRFLLGGAISPLTGLGPAGSAVVPSLVMLACALGSLYFALRLPPEAHPDLATAP